MEVVLIHQQQQEDQDRLHLLQMEYNNQLKDKHLNN
jgi:hypothetical protein